ncbi:MAG: pyridoxal-phosphate dependent enzyme [Chloroflexota bacterium]
MPAPSTQRRTKIVATIGPATSQPAVLRRLIEAGATFEEASAVVTDLSSKENLYYAHPANEPHLINGVGTEFIEMLDVVPDLDAVILPIGAGSEVAAAITVLKTVNPAIDIYAVQAEASSAAFQSWRAGHIVSSANSTFIMAALKLKETLDGKKAGLQFSGCNASPEEIQTAYTSSLFSEGLSGISA